MKQEYTVAHERELSIFKTTCSSLVSKGWTAQGGISVSFNPTGLYWLYAQAFVLDVSKSTNMYGVK